MGRDVVVPSSALALPALRGGKMRVAYVPLPKEMHHPGSGACFVNPVLQSIADDFARVTRLHSYLKRSDRRGLTLRRIRRSYSGTGDTADINVHCSTNRYRCCSRHPRYLSNRLPCRLVRYELLERVERKLVQTTVHIQFVLHLLADTTQVAQNGDVRHVESSN